MGFREGEDCESFRGVVFEPGGKFGIGFGPIGDGSFKLFLGFLPVGGVEDGSNIPGDLGALVQAGGESLGVALEVELAALAGHGGEAGCAGGFEAWVVIADDEFDAMEAAFLEVGEESAPMDFRFAGLAADAQDGAFAILIDADGDEDGATDDHAILADFFIAGIEDEVRERTQRAVAPLIKILFE